MAHTTETDKKAFFGPIMLDMYRYFNRQTASLYRAAVSHALRVDVQLYKKSVLDEEELRNEAVATAVKDIYDYYERELDKIKAVYSDPPNNTSTEDWLYRILKNKGVYSPDAQFQSVFARFHVIKLIRHKVTHGLNNYAGTPMTTQQQSDLLSDIASVGITNAKIDQDQLQLGRTNDLPRMALDCFIETIDAIVQDSAVTIIP